MTGFIFASISEFITCLFEYCLTRCRKNWLVDPTLFGRYPIAIPCAARKKSVITFITILSQFSQPEKIPAASFFTSQFLEYLEKKTSVLKRRHLLGRSNAFFPPEKIFHFWVEKKDIKQTHPSFCSIGPGQIERWQMERQKDKKHLQLTRRNLVTNWTVLSPLNPPQDFCQATRDYELHPFRTRGPKP